MPAVEFFDIHVEPAGTPLLAIVTRLGNEEGYCEGFLVFPSPEDSHSTQLEKFAVHVTPVDAELGRAVVLEKLRILASDSLLDNVAGRPARLTFEKSDRPTLMARLALGIYPGYGRAVSSSQIHEVKPEMNALATLYVQDGSMR